MKKYLKKEVIISFIIGAILASNIAVYAYSYMASSIGYTKPGTNAEISVEAALNDLYSKLNSEEYQKLNYIQSDGTQYIDTGVKLKENSVVKIHFRSISNGGNYALYGASNGNAYNIGEFACFWNKGVYDIVTPSSNTVSGVATNHPSYNTNTEYNIEHSFNQFKINETTYNLGETSTYIGNNNFYIFGTNRGSVVCPSAYQLYGMEIYEGETKVREFKPCFRKSDCAVGLYDEITHTFFTNSGTGTFGIG